MNGLALYYVMTHVNDERARARAGRAARGELTRGERRRFHRQVRRALKAAS